MKKTYVKLDLTAMNAMNDEKFRSVVERKAREGYMARDAAKAIALVAAVVVLSLYLVVAIATPAKENDIPTYEAAISTTEWDVSNSELAATARVVAGFAQHESEFAQRAVAQYVRNLCEVSGLPVEKLAEIYQWPESEEVSASVQLAVADIQSGNFAVAEDITWVCKVTDVWPSSSEVLFQIGNLVFFA